MEISSHKYKDTETKIFFDFFRNDLLTTNLHLKYR